MAAAPTSSRPVTSKSRGICQFYTTRRGCFAGTKCKFLHGDTHTPYDQAKTCRFYAAGFCKRGAQCWFNHAKGKEKEVIDEEDDLCSICFDKPVTYGLLTGCSHIFCITCIKQWRDPADKSADVVDSGNIKRCPMCRQPAKFIIPSSKFYAQGEAKDAAMARYMDSMKRVPCKHFQKSLNSPRGIPFCPFGKDCFYQHRNADGSDHIIAQGIDACMRYVHREAEQFRLLDAHRSGLIRQLESVFDAGMDDNALIRQRLEILMLAPFTGEDPHSGSESPSDEEEDDDGMPPLERIGGNRAADWPLPLMFDSSDSEAAESDADDDEDDRYSSTLETGDAPYDRMQTVRPFDLVFDPGMDARDAASNRGVFMRLRSFLDDMAHSDAGPSTSTPAESSARAVDSAVPDPPALVDAADEEDAGDEYDMPPLTPLEYEPPFVTDGRGRVVWSSSSDSGAGDSHQTSSSGPRRGSVSFPGACPSASPAEKTSSPRQTPSDDASRSAAREGGFTTDGRGRVIGTTGTREGEQDENADEESSTISDEAPIPSRSFFGRVLTAFF